MSYPYMLLFTESHGNIITSIGFLQAVLPLTIKHVLGNFSIFVMGLETKLPKGEAIELYRWVCLWLYARHILLEYRWVCHGNSNFNAIIVDHH